MRMIIVNVFNTVKTLRMSREMGAKKYFCVSTDKAANPVSMMGSQQANYGNVLDARESNTRYFNGTLCQCSFFRWLFASWV